MANVEHKELGHELLRKIVAMGKDTEADLRRRVAKHLYKRAGWPSRTNFHFKAIKDPVTLQKAVLLLQMIYLTRVHELEEKKITPKERHLKPKEIVASEEMMRRGFEELERRRLRLADVPRWKRVLRGLWGGSIMSV